MTSESHDIALKQRALARRAVSEAAAVSERLLEVHRRALMLLGDGADPSLPEEIDARMRLIEKRMLEAERLMRDAEQGMPPAANEEKR